MTESSGNLVSKLNLLSKFAFILTVKNIASTFLFSLKFLSECLIINQLNVFIYCVIN